MQKLWFGWISGKTGFPDKDLKKLNVDETLFSHSFSGYAKVAVAIGATDFCCIVTIATPSSMGLDRDGSRAGLSETSVMSSF